MASNDYHFVTRWRVRGDIETVFAVLADARGYVRWWPEVYLQIDVFSDGDGSGVGSRGRLPTRGWLPYFLLWDYLITENNPPQSFTLQASGDFVGTGVWELVQRGDWVDVTFTWSVRAEKPLLKYWSWILRLVFVVNHQWVMRVGGRNLAREVERVMRNGDTSNQR